MNTGVHKVSETFAANAVLAGGTAGTWFTASFFWFEQHSSFFVSLSALTSFLMMVWGGVKKWKLRRE